MIIDILTHVCFENGANIENWAKDRGHQVRYCHQYKGHALPRPEEVEFAAIMGGPMNIYDEKEFGWLKTEKKFIESLLKFNKPMIGVCLGSQLIADVLGGKVSKNEFREIGWHEVTLTSGVGKSFLAGIGPKFISFHWHGDTFAVPESAKLLASSQACRNQAFQYGNNVLGLQFHIEYQRRSIEVMIENCSDEMDLSMPYVQSEQDISAQMENVNINKKMLYSVLDAMVYGKS